MKYQKPTINILKTVFFSLFFFSFQVPAATSGNSGKSSEKEISMDAEEAPTKSATTHRLRAIDLDCEKHLVPDAKVDPKVDPKSDKPGYLDQEKLLLSAAKNKPFPRLPIESLAWMQKNLLSYGFEGNLSDLRGPSQMAALRIASLSYNDYVIASQMAYAIHMRQGLFVKPLADFMNSFIFNLTEDSDQTPETNYTNETINQAMQYFQSMTPGVKGYAKWVVRAYAYDDLVAIDAAMSGVCMSGPNKDDLSSLGKAIKLAQFDPKRNYKRPLVVPGLSFDSTTPDLKGSKKP